MIKGILFEKQITIHEDKTAFGNRFWIQVEDNEWQNNEDLRAVLDKGYIAKIMLLIPEKEEK